jgi:pyruvate dehydrogenase E1 component
VAADVWSVTSYKELHRDALDAERWNMLHPAQTPKVPYVSKCLGDAPGPIIAASDYLKALPDSICRWMPHKLLSLGTDGFGRSDGRDALRDFFEVDARHITVATLSYFARDNTVKPEVVVQALKDFNIDPEKPNPAIS